MTNPTPSLTDEQVAAIRARYESLRESQSKAGLHTLGRGARAAIRHNTERELARQDVPALLTDRDRLARRVEELEAALVEERARLVYDPSCESPSVALRQLDALRARILATVTEETPTPSPAQETP